MKTSTSTLCIACTMIAGLTFAQNGEKRPGGEGGAGRMGEFLQRIDANKDGKISKEEFLEFSKKEGEDRFGKIDANGDGIADENEMKSAMEKMRSGGERRGMREGGGPPGGGAEGGGFRRPPEGQGAPEGRRPEGGPEGRRPEGAGRPEGGRPEGGRPEGGRPEGGPPGGFGGGMRSMMGALANPDEAFKKMDKNSDGSVDAAEYKEATAQEVEARFKGLDQNNDGKVTAEEFKGALERMRGMMRGMGGQGGPGGAPGGAGGFRRPGGEGGEGGGFRRPPTQDGDKPAPKKDGV